MRRKTAIKQINPVTTHGRPPLRESIYMRVEEEEEEFTEEEALERHTLGGRPPNV